MNRLSVLTLSSILTVSAATIDFQPGNPPPGSNEIAIHFTGEFQGLTVGGLAGLEGVNFTSQNPNQLIKAHPGKGVAFITGENDGTVKDLVKVDLPFGITFGDISFNLQCGQNCRPPEGADLIFIANFDDGTSEQLARPFKNGQNRYTAFAVGAQFESVIFGATTPYSHIEQVKLSELAGPGIPEPSTYVLIGSGFLFVTFLKRKLV